MSVPIGVALIGSGIFAREEHLPAILSTPNLSLKAVYSRTLASASVLTSQEVITQPPPITSPADGKDVPLQTPTQQHNPLKQKIDWYSEETAPQGRGLLDLLSNTNIRAVIVALPIPIQASYVKQALEAGKHVLSEKPISADVESARKLCEWYRSDADGTGRRARATWSVAENYRFLDAIHHAAAEVKNLGRLMGFRGKVCRFMEPGNKYVETEWRKSPTFRGGFLLDSGVHFTAVLRLLLGPSNPITRVSAFTCQLQPHLPPCDTFNAILKTRSGISGTLAISAGTTFKGTGFTVAGEKGTVTLRRETDGWAVTVCDLEGKEGSRKFLGEGSRVGLEVRTWAEGIEKGEVDERAEPEEALRDLEMLEAILKSGEHDGAPIDLSLQT